MTPAERHSDNPSLVLGRQPSRLATVMAYVAMAFVCITACAGMALTILVFYPGYLTRDAAYVYGYVHSWYLGDWQSPLMTMLWWLIDPISPGSGSMFLLAATLYWLGFAVAALAVARRSAALAIAVLLLALAPPAFWFLAMIWRDVLFGTVWLAAAAIIYLATDRSRDGRLDWKMRGAALALVGLGILLRPNAIIAAPLLIAYVVWPARFEWKRTALLFVPAVLAGYGLIQLVYYEILDVHRDNPLQSVMVFDLGGMTYLTQENQFPVSWSADGYEDALLITQCYDPSHWDSYWTRDPCQFVMNRLQSADDTVFGTSRLPVAWVLAVEAHPLAYLRHRAGFLWTFLAGANATLELERMPLVDRVPLARNPYFLTIVDWHDVLKSTALFRAGTWLAVATAVVTLAWRGRATPPGAFAIAVAACAVVYMLSFGVFGVAPDFRYAYWCVVASLAGLIPALIALASRSVLSTS